MQIKGEKRRKREKKNLKLLWLQPGASSPRDGPGRQATSRREVRKECERCSSGKREGVANMHTGINISTGVCMSARDVNNESGPSGAGWVFVPGSECYCFRTRPPVDSPMSASARPARELPEPLPPPPFPPDPYPAPPPAPSPLLTPILPLSLP